MNQYVRQIKLDQALDVVNPMVELWNELTKDLVISAQKEVSNILWYKDNKCVLEHNPVDGVLWVSNIYIWSVFRTKFKISSKTDMQQIIEHLMYSTLSSLKPLTPHGTFL